MNNGDCATERNTITGWLSDGTKQHIKLVIKEDTATKNRAIVYVNGTEITSITNLCLQGSTTVSAPKLLFNKPCKL